MRCTSMLLLLFNSNKLLLLIFATSLLVHPSASTYSFTEELFIDPLTSGFVQFHFEFKSELERNHSSSIGAENYENFSKQFGDIAAKFDIDELSLTLSQGTWRYNEWSLPVKGAPSGSELWAEFGSSIPLDQLDSNWLQSSRAVSGLFGLSINLEDNPNTIVPKYSVKKSDDGINKMKKRVRYASMPNEIVCTENLTPWLKLLPCGNYKGLAQLFKNSPRLFESHYFMASVHFKKTCLDDKCMRTKLGLKQTLTLVYDVERVTRQLKPDQLAYTISNIFQRPIDGPCPVARLSKLYFNLVRDGATNPEPNEVIASELTKSQVAVFDLIELFRASNEFNPVFIHNKPPNKLKSILSTHRYITDTNERNFGIKTLIRNESPETLSIAYLDTIPWYFRVFVSTLLVKDENRNIWIKPDEIHFVPGLDRKRPHQIEMRVNLEPRSVYSVYFKAEFAYLKWDEFPPDVNHGFYINAPLVEIDFHDTFRHLSHYRHTTTDPFVSIYDNLKQNTPVKNLKIKVYSETLLMNLPTPDFSMPYNVICLTCTVVAIGFGSIHNFTTRRFVFLEYATLKEKLGKLVAKILRKKKNTR